MGRASMGGTGRRTAAVVAAVVAVLALVSGCTSDDGASATTSTTRPSSKQAAASTSCDRGAAKVTATPVAGSTSDVDVTSFDGTVIRAHWFPVDGAGPDARKPTVLMGPGWSQPGDTDVDAVGILGAINIATLRGAGYNVLTWDPRGFGESTGEAEVDSARYEARDVSALIDWAAGRPEVALDRDGDPSVGMVGGSYGGGIQFVTAATDCRVDATVPIIAWHSLRTSLYKNQTVKEGWATILTKSASSASLDPHITDANEEGMATGVLSEENIAWFAARGPGDLVKKITAPTMVVGGTVDTLFTLQEDIQNYGMLRESGTPSSMYWFCGGHGTCLTETGDATRMSRRIIHWLDRYVKRDESVDVGPRFDFLDQSGARYTADDYPLPAGEPIRATGAGSLDLEADGGSGPGTIPPDKVDVIASVAADLVPSVATRSIDVAIPVDRDAMVVGAPKLTLTYKGTTPDGERPTRLFAQIVDLTPAGGTPLVLGNQITPIAVQLDGKSHTVSLPLEVVAHQVTAGSKLQLQIVATSTLYAQPRLGGTVDVTEASVRLPTVTGYHPVG